MSCKALNTVIRRTAPVGADDAALTPGKLLPKSCNHLSTETRRQAIFSAGLVVLR